MRKLFERATDYEYPRPVLPWALSIAAWECRTIARRRQRRRESSDVIEATSPLPSPDATFVEQELIRAAQAALSHLSERDAQTLETAFYAEDREAQSPAFRKRKQRAIEKLRQVMRKLYGIG
jgi:RNA polymerase sigma-70 factor (ECF subfamily)